MTCDRCGQDATLSTVSFFNTDILCMPCTKTEQAHPQYEEACRVEREHVLAGDMNFPGIGLPSDLKPLADGDDGVGAAYWAAHHKLNRS